jgi:hypothetical protein
MTRRRLFTEEEVRAIRAQHKPHVPGHGYGALARAWKCGESTIRDLVNRVTYFDVRDRAAS